MYNVPSQRTQYTACSQVISMSPEHVEELLWSVSLTDYARGICLPRAFVMQLLVKLPTGQDWRSSGSDCSVLGGRGWESVNLIHVSRLTGMLEKCKHADKLKEEHWS